MRKRSNVQNLILKHSVQSSGKQTGRVNNNGVPQQNYKIKVGTNIDIGQGKTTQRIRLGQKRFMSVPIIGQQVHLLNVPGRTFWMGRNQKIKKRAQIVQQYKIMPGSTIMFGDNNDIIWMNPDINQTILHSSNNNISKFSIIQLIGETGILNLKSTQQINFNTTGQMNINIQETMQSTVKKQIRFFTKQKYRISAKQGIQIFTDQQGRKVEPMVLRDKLTNWHKQLTTQVNNLWSTFNSFSAKMATHMHPVRTPAGPGQSFPDPALAPAVAQVASKFGRWSGKKQKLQIDTKKYHSQKKKVE